MIFFFIDKFLGLILAKNLFRYLEAGYFIALNLAFTATAKFKNPRQICGLNLAF
nr:hypothetical protein [uncultured Campylobacter sp.]